MNISSKLLAWAAVSVLLICLCIALLYLPRINASPGIPQGRCSVKSLLLQLDAFPPGTTMSLDENFENTALETASHYFVNGATKLEAYHSIEYYYSPFLAWQTYEYRSGIFKESTTNGPWTQWNGISFSSSTANQYHYACSTDSELGDRCMLTARYGRYFVFFRANLSNRFSVQHVAPLLRQIDARMTQCTQK